jgi:alpha-glucosidase
MKKSDEKGTSGGAIPPTFNRRKLIVGVAGGATVVAAGVWAPRAWHDRQHLPPEFNRIGPLTLGVQSPNGKLRAELLLDAVGGAAPRWRVEHQGKTVLEPSLVGLTLADGRKLGPGVRVIGYQTATLDETWAPPYGISARYAGTCQQLALQVMDVASGIMFDIVLRAYDSGIAIRYLVRFVPDQESIKLSTENTHFRFPSSTLLYASRDEGEYQLTSPAKLAPVPHPDLTPSSEVGFFADVPLTASLPNGLTVVVAESDRIHYPRLMLQATDEPDTLVSHLMRYPGRADGWSGPGETPAEEAFSVATPFSTPWRVLIIGERPGDVIENAGLIATLATASELEAASWIRPGRAFRSFRDNTTAAGTACADFAARRKLEYIEFDAHWYGDGTDGSDATVPVAGLDIQKVIEYARSKNIGVILYVDRTPAMRQLDDIVRTYQQWGVAGIKFGFMWEGRQSDNDWLYHTIRKCGEHQLLVCVHDNARPAGLERTLPNYVSLEGVRGNEQFPTARHNVTLPFTANVAGPIDYTICYANERSQTTNAHQLAMAAVYYCPLTFLYWYDRPPKYANGSWPELTWFDACPTVWDETRVLDGRIGEFVIVARRHKQRWFLGAMTNEQSRDIEVSLTFLGVGNWTAYVYADGPPASLARETTVAMETRTVSAKEFHKLVLAPSGGQAIRFEKID